MKINIHHGNDYLNGYLNIEMRDVQRTDQKASDHYIINGVVNNDFIDEIICHPGALESSSVSPKEILDSWFRFSTSGSILKLKIIDVEAFCSSVAFESESIKSFNDHMSGYKRFFGRSEINSVIKESGFKINKTWYGPMQWILNIEAIKQ
jgi:hypothetical protein